MSIDSNIALSTEQSAILQEMLLHQGHIFLSGRAGTGKSLLIHKFKQQSSKNAVTLAPTGIAALNINGQTIHSFFKFPPKILIHKEFHRRRNSKIYTLIDVIIIDEVSMLRADLLDAIDRFLQINRRSFEPFGGVQMIFIGDLFQLPPVVPPGPEQEFLYSTYESPYFFSAHVIHNGLEILFLELDSVYRQNDISFINLLGRVRNGEIDSSDLEILNNRHNTQFANKENVITLCSTNAISNAINYKKLSEITSQSDFRNAQIKGKFPSHLFPVDENLHLKLNAQVMLVRNDPAGIYVNGTIGKIVALETDHIKIASDDTPESPFVVKPIEWEITKFITEKKDGKTILSTETIGHFKQYPIRLAWAITIHKSQGQTYNHVIIDLGRGAFTHGQTYVALSRSKSLEGIVLRRPIQISDIIMDEKIIEFYQLCRRFL